MRALARASRALLTEATYSNPEATSGPRRGARLSIAPGDGARIVFTMDGDARSKGAALLLDLSASER